MKNKEDISPELMLGDVDGDKDISVMDATLIQLAISRQVTLTDVQINAADTDQDGDMNIMDATAIQLYVAKIITEF
ncbi:MAG: dockerin type I repeat-containing protein [Ruminococcus sp.]|nr:dockerin type I repeat-containing protein [Ruminococcus sp.]